MDADNSPTRNAPAPVALGGAVEPANRATVAKELFQTPVDVPTKRYELRDPFAEVTYRSNNFPDMVAKANQLGSSRFVAVDERGYRTPVQKVDGQWKKAPSRDQQQAAETLRAANVTPVRGDVARSSTAAHPSPAPAQADIADSPSLAKVEAQAERAALVARVEAALTERYIIKRAPVTIGDVTIGRTEYRFRGDTTRVAFTESTFRLATDTNSPSVARSMVDVAQARNWRALRVSGNEDFKRLVWLEASARGVKTLGYEPTPADIELLNKARETRLVNRIEPERTVTTDNTGATPGAKSSKRGSGGRKTVLVAIEAVLVAKGVPERQREAVMAAAAEKLEQRIRAGQAPKVKVYDKDALSQRPTMTPTPEKQRTRERPSQTR